MGQQIQGPLMLPILIEQGHIGEHQGIPVRKQLSAGLQQGQTLLHGPAEAAEQLLPLEQETAVSGLQTACLGNLSFGQGAVAVVEIRDGQIPVHRSQGGQLHGRGLPVADGGGILPAVIEQAAEIIMGLRRGRQQGNGVFQNPPFLGFVREAQIRGQGLRLFREGLRGLRAVHPALRIRPGIVFQGAFRGAAVQKVRGILPEAEAEEIIGDGQVFLDPPAGRPVKGGLIDVPAEQGQIQGIDGQAFVQEVLVFRTFRAQMGQDGGLQAPGPHVVPAAQEAFLREAQRLREVSPAHAEAGEMEEGGPGRLAAPYGLEEGVIGLGEPL